MAYEADYTPPPVPDKQEPQDTWQPIGALVRRILERQK